MTRAFNDREKEIIRQALIEKGRELFLSYGLKKTSIADITRAVGIAQGSFYIFFDSKEDLYFEILQIEEEKIRGSLIDEQLLNKKLTKEVFKLFLKEAFKAIESPLIKTLLIKEEYENLVRKLSEEKVKQHLQNDSKEMLPLIEYWQSQGIMKKIPAEIIISSIRTLFIMSLHKKEIGEEIYEETISFYIEALCEQLILE
ncbi:TetR/AcrR family transcriptional regulator [Desnuesiella massiliensis]|uniref:TetR/AcrR family transcriptional regulator n=1 Tax=Desnuesiella massiliensis TaxID=1650662 RepID=UPI0006E3C25B|nr:TetR/AcrR family transcriptional regulator [Desnuesiella massiliensis]